MASWDETVRGKRRRSPERLLTWLQRNLKVAIRPCTINCTVEKDYMQRERERGRERTTYYII